MKLSTQSTRTRLFVLGACFFFLGGQPLRAEELENASLSGGTRNLFLTSHSVPTAKCWRQQAVT